ncbi:MAG: SH3 domain-containing protein [Spirulinaceae cyanobacterium]
MPKTPWKSLLLLLSLASGLGSTAPAQASPNSVAQRCEYGRPKSYVQVVTHEGDDLRIRATPGGAIIGAVPNGWAVVALETSADGRWLRITSHHGDIYPGEIWSAPHLRSGWISRAYTKDLGSFCSKPVGFAQLMHPEMLGESVITVQPDWLALGDMLTQS